MSVSKNEFKQIIAPLLTALDYNPSDLADFLRVYYTSLVDVSNLSSNDLKECVKRFVLTWDCDYGKKFPKVADFLRLAGKSPNQLSERALKIAIKYASRVGYNQSINFGDDRTSRAIMATIQDLGGWSRFCANYWEEKIKSEFKLIWIEKYLSRNLIAPKFLKSPIGGKKNVVTLKPNQLLIGG